MRAGNLRNLIVIEEQIQERNSLGEIKPFWQEFVQAWASVEPLRGREFMEARQINADIDVRIRARYQPGVRTDMRVKWDDGGTIRYFRITAPPIVAWERKREMQLMCKEVSDGG